MREYKAHEHDSCALIGLVRKDCATHGAIRRTLRALEKMAHRSGSVNGESDGTGVMIDLPRQLWAHHLQARGLTPQTAYHPNFGVAHLFLSYHERERTEQWLQHAQQVLQAHHIETLGIWQGGTYSDALGPKARQTEPLFVQIAFLVESENPERALFHASLQLERETPIHVVSLSRTSVVYKVYGSVSTLLRYYPDLTNPLCQSQMVIGHCRYSTNTWTTFERAQPFALLGHNGEINTIERLRREGAMLGVQFTPDGSDSQDVDRLLHHLIVEYGFSLLEAIYVLFPPVASEVEHLPEPMRGVLEHYRRAFGPFAQGPAAIVARWGNQMVASVDAMGLRPLWFVETVKDFAFTSERGVLSIETFLADPVPLAPSEKRCLTIAQNGRVSVQGADFAYQVPVHCSERLMRHSETPMRHSERSEESQTLRFAQGDGDRKPGDKVRKTERGQGGEVEIPRLRLGMTDKATREELGVRANREAHGRDARATESEEQELRAELLSFFGWTHDEAKLIEAIADTGNEPIASLGYDGPLACIHPEGMNLSDYYQELVAVVTNPALDRERETEQFNTEVWLGKRPPLTPEPQPPSCLRLKTPLLLDIESLIAQGYFDKEAVCRLSLTYTLAEGSERALQRLCTEAVEAVRQGAILLVLDDSEVLSMPTAFLDPHLALASVDRALRSEWLDEPNLHPSEHNLRRRCSLILRSGAIRSLHDIVFAHSLGADALVPYMLYRVALGNAENPEERLRNVIEGLTKGIEKVIATMGTHELRGYGKNFAGIGVSTPIAEILECPNFLGSEQVGFSFTRWDAEMRRRLEAMENETTKRPNAPLPRVPRFYPQVWKTAGRMAQGSATPEEYESLLHHLESDRPVALRHLIGIRYPDRSSVAPESVDLSIGGHDLPFLISSMSFGSQGEVAYTAYAEAAYRLNMLSLSGEGGELPQLIGRYPFHRGQQVASGRFGVNAEYLNSSYWLEIKIGQGAKPGEGGHLPGRKVTQKVAQVRYAVPGTDLISPNNNHDLYSIEDLAQLISELKTVNPRAKVVVKVPVVANIGVIAVGIAKAGADVIMLSGYDGGTGAARAHAIHRAGLPVEIGLHLAHHALVQAGLRDSVELWADGGIRSATDVVRMVLLGANRVGMATLAMVAIGCTICRGCQTDTCHVGIATQMTTVEQAQARGLKRFEPQQYDLAVARLVQFFQALGDGVRQLVARLGYDRLQSLVGRADLLYQLSHTDTADLSSLFVSAPLPERREGNSSRRISRLRSYTTQWITQAILSEVDHSPEGIVYEDTELEAMDQAIGAHLAGTITRARIGLPTPKGYSEWMPEGLKSISRIDLCLRQTLAGHGLGAFNVPPLAIRVEGGAQDGVAKSACGGMVAVLKGTNLYGARLDGSVGKSFAYGAQRGLFIVQGYADSRACVRLSGAEVVFGARLQHPVDTDPLRCLDRAHLKGFAFEYMTGGRVVVLGDPGPYLCAGMTGGVVYVKLWHEWGLDENALQRRLARGAKVRILPVQSDDLNDLRRLLLLYAHELDTSQQHEEANAIRQIVANDLHQFVKIVPITQQEDQSVSTE